MLLSSDAMAQRSTIGSFELRPLQPGEALIVCEPGGDGPFEIGCRGQRPQPRYAPMEPRGVVLRERTADGSRRIGYGMLRAVEGAHALGEAIVHWDDGPPVGEGLCERIVDALVAIAKLEGMRRLRVVMREQDVAASRWIRRLATQPNVCVEGRRAMVEFPVAAFCALGSASSPTADAAARPTAVNRAA